MKTPILHKMSVLLCAWASIFLLVCGPEDALAQEDKAGGTGTNVIASTNQTVAATSSNAVTSAAGTNAVSVTNVTNIQTTVINAVPATIPANVKLTPALEEIVKLARAGVDESVMLAFVEKSPEPFELNAE